MKVISIYNENVVIGEGITYHESPTLSDDKIRGIVMVHVTISSRQADRWG